MGNTNSNNVAAIPLNNMAAIPPNNMAMYQPNNMFTDINNMAMYSRIQMSKETIISFFFLVFLTEIKDIIKVIVLEIGRIIRRSPVRTLLLYNRIKNMLSKTKQKPVQHIERHVPRIIPITATKTFLKSIYYYVKNNNKCRYIEQFEEVIITNTKKSVNSIVLSNIEVGNIFIFNKLRFHVDSVNDTVDDVFYTDENVCTDKYTSYLDMFNESQKNVIIRTTEKFFNKYGYNYSDINYIVDGIIDNSKLCTIDEVYISKMICQKYRKFDFKHTIFTIGILCAVNIDNLFLHRFYGGHFIFDKHNSYQCNDYVSDTQYILKDLYPTKDWFSSQMTTIYNIQNCFGLYLQKMGEEIQSKPLDVPKKLKLELPDSLTLEESYQIINKFVKKIEKYQPKSSNQVKIHTLHFSTIIKTNEVPNPLYEQWLEKKKIIDQSCASEDRKSNVTFDISNMDIPTKTIIVESQEREIRTIELNTISKLFDTLYLREKDKKKLLNSLDQFKNRKEIIQDLGLPNKLNVLLHGAPGTGKSTTIQAVATYLEKDMYYLDLNNIKTNGELGEMFEYVNKNIPSGGIIVIEDIDAMVDIVHKRKFTKEEVNSRDSKITLEYLLNILQGTLTLDDSIFIVTTNHIEELDPAFYRSGRFDVNLELKMCDHFQISSIYRRVLGRDIPPSLLEKVPEDKFTPADLIFSIKDYISTKEVSDEEVMKDFMIN